MKYTHTLTLSAPVERGRETNSHAISQLRQQRKVDLEKHVEEVNRLVKQANGEIPGLGGDDDEESSGDEDDFKGFEEPEPINQEDEYIDEDKYTTVTIESVGISRDGFSRPGDASDDEDNIKKAAAAAAKAEEGAVEELGKKAMGKPEIKRDANGKRIWTKEKPKIEWVKKKKKKFRYETKAERKVERAKLGAKKKKQREARSKKDEK